MSKKPFLKFLGLTSISLALATLVACGGSSSEPAKVTGDLPSISLSASNVDLAKVVGTALSGKSLSLTGSLDLPNGQKVDKIPASTLAFTAVPAGAPANALTGVTFKNEYYEATGFTMPGSLNVILSSLIWLGTPNPAIWTPQIYTSIAPVWWDVPSFMFPVFTVDFATSGFTVGPYIANGVVSFGNGNNLQITAPVNVTSNSNGTNIVIGNTSLPVPTQPATGATGN